MRVADVVIESIAAGGDGVARSEGMVIFVPRSAPGDRLRVKLDVRKRFSRGTIDEILTPSPARVEPPCDHYRIDRCGGCQLQHLDYDAQLAAKRGIVHDALTRIARRTVEPPTVEASTAQWRYRRKLTLAMRRGRGGDWVIGLHPYDDPVGVFALKDCPITDERVVAVWREIIAARALLPRADELRGFVQWTADGAAVGIHGGTQWSAQSQFFDAVRSATALWWRPATRPRALVGTRGAASASFVQVNEAVGDRLHSYVLDRARSYAPKVVVDAYAGSGATAIPLANDGRRVVAIEFDRDATARCAAALPAGSRAVHARVEDAIESELPADVVLINPPRTGIDERVATALQLVTAAPRAIIYVSCDPATLARDVARMPRYRIASLRSFDMFPQTAHVETVCELVPEAE
jgi:23S rRNA (uracil1939-C5)-methyltransferase